MPRPWRSVPRHRARCIEPRRLGPSRSEHRVRKRCAKWSRELRLPHDRGAGLDRFLRSRALRDRGPANQLYMVGSMGCVVPLALGLALARPDLRVVALDGDGAALMRMGAFATVGAYGPPQSAAPVAGQRRARLHRRSGDGLAAMCHSRRSPRPAATLPPWKPTTVAGLARGWRCRRWTVRGSPDC